MAARVRAEPVGWTPDHWRDADADSYRRRVVPQGQALSQGREECLARLPLQFEVYTLLGAAVLTSSAAIHDLLVGLFSASKSIGM